jgi:formylglycine-generating enzyme required for sulfatase activity
MSSSEEARRKTGSLRRRRVVLLMAVLLNVGLVGAAAWNLPTRARKKLWKFMGGAWPRPGEQGPRQPAAGDVPEKLREGKRVRQPDGSEVQVYLWPLPGAAGDMELVYVPWGWFEMGDDERNGPKHQQPIGDGYWIGRNDVTWKQYVAFFEATSHGKPDRPEWAGDDHPVVNVDWNDAKAFAAWAGTALPSEAEWEKAARGTDGREYPWGSEFNSSKCNSDESGLKRTSPVGAFPGGASPYGALDMAGNAWQWCEDLSESGGSSRVSRGGSWFFPAPLCRSSYRFWYAPSYRNDYLGFRIVLRSVP